MEESAAKGGGCQSNTAREGGEVKCRLEQSLSEQVSLDDHLTDYGITRKTVANATDPSQSPEILLRFQQHSGPFVVGLV